MAFVYRPVVTRTAKDVRKTRKRTRFFWIGFTQEVDGVDDRRPLALPDGSKVSDRETAEAELRRIVQLAQRRKAGLIDPDVESAGIPVRKVLADFLRHAATNVRNPARKEGEELMPMKDFRKELKAKMEQLRMNPDFASRYVNDGFSGGEMKRAEILQMAMLQPKIAVLDETDSGLDADAVRLASQSIAEIGREKMGLLIITHHDKLLEHNPPDFTHVILGGRIVESGGKELAAELHTQGYDRIRKAHPDADAANRTLEEAEKKSA